ncbi:MAG TPA: DUF4386 domain-containing protein [Thermoanaerobaculia bacterium]|nr:DUF4386 domain-containing protein [Thermoanaerobaculia bacterium]
MTRATNARIAGVTLLVYIAATMTSVVLFSRAIAGEGVAAQLAGIGRHAMDVRLTILAGLLGNLCALVLGVTLYSITRGQDQDLAMLAMICRVAEGVAGIDVSRTLGLLWLTTATDAAALDRGAATALGAYFLKMETSFTASGAFFALGSAVFSWLLLRGRMIPAPLAWLGVLGSIFPAVFFPLQLAGLVSGSVTRVMWYPVLLFEVVLAFWFLIKGVAAPAPDEGR